MFVNIMRSNQRWLMGIISVLVIISFIWFYSDRTQVDRIVSDKVGKIYGRNLGRTEVERILRQLSIARGLGLVNMVNLDPMGRGDQLDEVVNHLVMAHKAEEMGIYPSDDDVLEAIKKLPVFQSDGGQFDVNKYNQFVSERLAPGGFSEGQLEELVRRDIQFARVHAIVDAPVVVSPVETRLAYDERYAKTDASVIRFKTSDFAAGVAEPTEDEIKKAFDNAKEQYIQPEKRKVQYVKFALSDEDKKLTGKAKMDKLKPLADQAVALLSELLDNKQEDFATAAKKLNTTVKETPEFEQSQTTGFEEASIPGFAQAAFQLTQAEPDSNVPLQEPNAFAPDAYYDLHLAGVVPVRPLTLDEARPKVVQALKDERAKAALSAKAEEVRTKIADALKAGKSFADAAKDAGQTAQEVPAYSAAEPARTAPDAATIAQATSDLGAQELSKFVPTDAGGLLVYVRDRTGVDQAKFAQQEGMVAMRLSRMKSGFYFSEWLRVSRDAADVEVVPQHGGRS